MNYRFIVNTYYEFNEELTFHYFIKNQNDFALNMQYRNTLFDAIQQHIKQPSEELEKRARRIIEKHLEEKQRYGNKREFFDAHYKKEVMNIDFALTSVPDRIEFGDQEFHFERSVLRPEKQEMVYYYERKDVGGLVLASIEKNKEIVEKIFRKLIEVNRLHTIFQ